VESPRTTDWPAGTTAADDSDLVDALRAGDEERFAHLVDSLAPAMLRVAEGHVPTRTVAEEVVQETWLAVLTGLERFERRASLRTWVFGILLNIARTRGSRERRSLPFSSAFPDDNDGPTVDPARFRPAGDAWHGRWAAPPRRPGSLRGREASPIFPPAPLERPPDLPEPALLSQEVRTRLRTALDALPPRQRSVVHLRDVQGFDADEVCRLLDLTPGNQRVLLHRGRARLRQALEEYLDGGQA
jgi:RNA polymerase sigma-70 factor (ECF subfamily)